MKKLLLVSLLGVAALVQSYATIFTVTVGTGGSVFAPNSITNVVVGDTVRFVYGGGFHTTTSVGVPGDAATWNAPMQSANTFDYKVTVPGEYTYKCNIHSGMTGSFVASAATGIEASASALSNMTVTQSTKDMLSLSVTSVQAMVTKATIMNAIGVVVTSQEIALVQGQNNITIPTSTLGEGMYFVQLSQNNNQAVTKRFIKE